MLPARVTQTTLRALDWLSAKFLPPDETADHLQTGRRGEEDAYFYLRRRGYTIIARNYRSPNHRGELDLIGWVREKAREKVREKDGARERVHEKAREKARENDAEDILCFIEVKTRTTRAIQPAEAAVDREKEDDLRRVAHDFLRHLPDSCPARFDVLAVYYDRGFSNPTFELFQNAFSMSYNRELARRY
jgi:putative endonuclease